MTNGSKYKTAQERAQAFEYFCEYTMAENCHKCPLGDIDWSCRFSWLDLEAEEEKPSFSVSKSCDIQIGDTVAYKTMDDNKEEWACFTIRAMDNEYFYENEDHSGDNIAKGCCYKVNVNRMIVAEEEKTLPCPFCGKDCNVIEFHTPIGFRYKIGCIECAYSSMQYKTQDDAIAAHNRVAKAVRESEGK